MGRPQRARGDADAGLIIHEGQLTYENQGLKLIVDLGEWWYELTDGLPLPLGANAIRKDLGQQVMDEVTAILKQSIQYGLDHREAALDHAGRVGAKGILAGVHRLQADLYGRRGSRAVAEEHAARADALEAALRSRSPQFPGRDPHPSGESDTLTRSTTEGVV